MIARTARRQRRPERRQRLRSLIAIVLLAVAGFVAAGTVLPTRTVREPKPVEDVHPAPPELSGETAFVATDMLNLREAASLDAAIVDTWPNGREVTVVGDTVDGFLPVAYGDGQAWMAAEFLWTGAAPDAGGWRSAALLQEAAAAEPWESESVIVADEPVAQTVPESASSRVPDPVADAVDVATFEEAEAIDVVNEPLETGEQWIEVDRDTATVILHDGATVAGSFHGKVGWDASADGFYATALGTFHVYSMWEGLAPTPFAEDVYLTDWVGFDPERNNGFHSPVRDAVGNEKASQNATTLGCVRLDADAARAVFAFAQIGMRVEIHE